jgi:hypothetical protein
MLNELLEVRINWLDVNLCSGNVVRSHWIGFELDTPIIIPLTVVFGSDLYHCLDHFVVI